jgi:hypothetical protein
MPETPTPIPPGPHGELALTLDTTVLDVGLAGVAVECESRLTLDRPLRVRLGAGGGALVLPGSVVWCFFHGTAAAASGEQRPVYRAGIEFSDLLTPAARRLMSFLEREVAPDGDTRMFGRFPLTRSQTIGVEATTPFHCLELGADRALVEVELGVEPLAGQRATLVARGSDAAIAATVRTARRGEGPETWRLELGFDDAEPRAMAALRGVAAN